MFHFEVSSEMETTFLSNYELETGKPMPSKHHAKLQARLSQVLLNAYEQQYDIYSELSLELLTGKATPDIAVYPKSTDNWLIDEIRVTNPPLSVMEILSPTQGLQDLTDKFAVYFGEVKSYWVLIPNFKTIHIITPDLQVATFAEGIAKDKTTGIEIAVAALFK
ncbi:MAG: Uma2 family endonuclease [Cytophagales bacterium]|jgi:Uma2 family endonuclease|nr:Uma2 family endonuclease [Cytophagales bacterium]